MMKKLPAIPIPVLFSLCLVAGILVGTRAGRAIGKNMENTPRSVPPGQAELLQPGNGQRNILVFLVDRLEKKSPRLEGIWLALYIPSSPGLTLLPIYPAGSASDAVVDETLAAQFELAADFKPNASFLDALRSADLWWNHLIVLDEIAMIELIDLTGGVQMGGVGFNGLQAVAALPLAWEDPNAALKGQFRLIDTLCREKPSQKHPIDLDVVMDQLSRHLATDLEPEQLLADWKSIKANDGRLCRFPTLSQAAQLSGQKERSRGNNLP